MFKPDVSLPDADWLTDKVDSLLLRRGIKKKTGAIYTAQLGYASSYTVRLQSNFTYCSRAIVNLQWGVGKQNPTISQDTYVDQFALQAKGCRNASHNATQKTI